MANFLLLLLLAFLAAFKVVMDLKFLVVSPFLEALDECFHLKSLGAYFFPAWACLAVSLLFSLRTVRHLAMAFLVSYKYKMVSQEV